MPDERVLFAIAVRLVLMTAALINVHEAFEDWSRHHGDARGLRGFAAALTMLAGVLAIVGSSPVIREAYPVLDRPMSFLAIMATTAFCIGILFSVYSWRPGRRETTRATDV